MQSVFQYIIDYYRTVDKWLFAATLFLIACLIFFNYKLGIETKIHSLPFRWQRFGGFYCLYAIAFIVPYLLLFLIKNPSVINLPNAFWLLLFIAPAIFAAKVSMGGWNLFAFHEITPIWKKYYNLIADLPIRLLIVVIPLLLIKYYWRYEGAFWGLTGKGFDPKPYFIMLLIMVPLIIFASSQHDFLVTYPKMKNVHFIAAHTSKPWLYNLLYEISYSIDFISIELFFRGFLVIAFIRYAGQDAILPMAVFYCSIHFGKPLLECISSFFGGLLLGIITYNTQSILGGLMVHLGIAWMMEVGGYWGNFFRKR